MIDYINIKPKKVIILDGDPHVVLSSHVKKKNRQKPSNQTRLKNLISGATIDKAFHQSDKVEEADIGEKEIKYLYNNKGVWWFCAPDNPKDRFILDEETIGESRKFMKENTTIRAQTFNDEIIGISLPAKINLRVIEAPPSIKGNTSAGGSKPVVVETGATVDTPLFIEEGDIIRVNTETGGYAERVEKA
jgi:elongation factor P